MGTVPTSRMEAELRALYLRWLARLPQDGDLTNEVNTFQRTSTALIQRMGGQVASLGALAGFPTPKLLQLSPHAGIIYDEMKQAAIQASIQAGISSKEAARAMFNAGMDKSYRRLERLARTETTSAYWKNSWDSVADLPAIVMVWGSEQGKKTCDYCIARDGLVVEDRNIRDHPNGRCTLIPTLRSMVKYKGTLQPDGSVTMDPRWFGQKAKGAKPQASAGPTTAEQRDPLSGKSNPAAPSQAQAAQRSQGSAPAAPALVPEEAFVANLQDMLATGKVTVKALQAQAAAASDLAKVNVAEAVARYQAQVLAKKAEQQAAAKALKPPVVHPAPDGVTRINSVGGMKKWGKTMPTPSSLATHAANTTAVYTSNSAYSINAILRGQSKVFGKNPVTAAQRANAKKFVPRMDELMDKSIVTEPVQVVRGVTLDAFGGEEALLKMVGKTYRDDGYLSTSLMSKLDKSVYDVGNHVAVEMKIVVPKGARALYLGEESEVLGERELLLDRGTKMALQSAKFNARRNVWEVTATVLPGKRP